jgi:hypothetical protein
MLDKIILVEWEDIVAHSGWTAKDGFNTPPALIHTIGLLVQDVPEFITVSSTWGPPDTPTEYNQHITIPRGAITKIYNIKLIVEAE